MLEREQIDYLMVNAYNAALRAGADVLDIYQNSADFQVNMKCDSTPITEADRQSHTTIKNYLSQTRIPLLSEEGRNLLFEERCNWDLFWLVDPLDGTKEFIKRNGEFTINIALMIDNVPYIGIVYVPYLQKMYVGDRDRGSFLKTGVAPDAAASYTISEIFSGVSSLPLPEGKLHHPLRVAVSRSHISPETDAYLEELKAKCGPLEVLKQGSSYKLCLIAEGSVDYYPRTTDTFEWDTAAGHCVIAAAGARIEDLYTGEELKYNKENIVNPYFLCRSKFAL